MLNLIQVWQPTLSIVIQANYSKFVSFLFFKWIFSYFFQAGNPGMSLSNDVRRTFRCPVKDCTFATFRRSSIISHVGFGHKFFRQTNLRSAIRGLDLGTLFDAERRQKRDVVNDAKASCSKKANCGATILADVVDLDSDDWVSGSNSETGKNVTLKAGNTSQPILPI